MPKHPWERNQGFVRLALKLPPMSFIGLLVRNIALGTRAAFFQDALAPDWSALPPTVLIKTAGDRKGHYRTTGEEGSPLALLSLDVVRENRADPEFLLRVDPLARRRSSTDLCWAHISGRSASFTSHSHSLYFIAEAAGQTRSSLWLRPSLSPNSRPLPSHNVAESQKRDQNVKNY